LLTNAADPVTFDIVVEESDKEAPVIGSHITVTETTHLDPVAVSTSEELEDKSPQREASSQGTYISSYLYVCMHGADMVVMMTMS